MAKSYEGSIKEFSSNLNVQITRPLDDRLVVDSIDDLTNGSIDFPYVGMVVNVMGLSSVYVLVDNDTSDISNWKEIKDYISIETFVTNLITELTNSFNDKLKSMSDIIESQQQQIDEIQEILKKHKIHLKAEYINVDNKLHLSYSESVDGCVGVSINNNSLVFNNNPSEDIYCEVTYDTDVLKFKELSDDELLKK